MLAIPGSRVGKNNVTDGIKIFAVAGHPGRVGSGLVATTKVTCLGEDAGDGAGVVGVCRDELVGRIEQARQRPTLYKSGRVKGTREIVVRPNYVMVYRVEDDGCTLCVLRVLHAAQQWPPAV